MAGRWAGRACRQEGDSDEEDSKGDDEEQGGGEGGDDEQESFKRVLTMMSPEACKNYALGLMAALRGDTDCRTEKRGGQQRVGHHSWELAVCRLPEWCLAFRLAVLFFVGRTSSSSWSAGR